MSEVKKIAEAEKGNNLSPENLHIRLRVLEVIVLLSLTLNLALWYFAGHVNQKVENQADSQQVQTQR